MRGAGYCQCIRSIGGEGLLVGGVATTRKRGLPFFPGTALGGL